jgi:hypothetical protein
MKTVALVAVVVGLVGVGFGILQRASAGVPVPPAGVVASPDKECGEAVALANALLATLKVKPADYKLIVAKNLVVRGKEFKGPHIWDLTYKLRSLLPDQTDGIVGAGGEVFIDVDLATKKATLRGYGE